jgi:hypothetical protein
MEVEERKSSLFQTRLSKRDTAYFRNPDNQPAYNPLNCAAVSAQLLGIIPKSLAERMTARFEGAYIQEWEDALNYMAGKRIYRIQEAKMVDIYNDLFDGFATLVLFTRVNGPGHYCVLASGPDHELYLLDAQMREVYQGRGEIEPYLQRQRLDGPALVIRTTPKTKEEHVDTFINDVLSWQLSQCRLGGKKKRTTRKRKMRSIRKRNTRKRR